MRQVRDRRKHSERPDTDFRKVANPVGLATYVPIPSNASHLLSEKGRSASGIFTARSTSSIRSSRRQKRDHTGPHSEAERQWRIQQRVHPGKGGVAHLLEEADISELAHGAEEEGHRYTPTAEWHERRGEERRSDAGPLGHQECGDSQECSHHQRGYRTGSEQRLPVALRQHLRVSGAAAQGPEDMKQAEHAEDARYEPT